MTSFPSLSSADPLRTPMAIQPSADTPPDAIPDLRSFTPPGEGPFDANGMTSAHEWGFNDLGDIDIVAIEADLADAASEVEKAYSGPTGTLEAPFEALPIQTFRRPQFTESEIEKNALIIDTLLTFGVKFPTGDLDNLNQTESHLETLTPKDWNKTDEEGRTPVMHLASQISKTKSALKVINLIPTSPYGLDLGAVDTEGRNVLHHLLLDNSIESEKTTKRGERCRVLETSVYPAFLYLLSRCIQEKVDWDRSDNEGNSIWSLAERMRGPESQVREPEPEDESQKTAYTLLLEREHDVKRSRMNSKTVCKSRYRA